jgi:hypothetical protein
MQSPFPGMDPFLEDSDIWSDFHHALAEELRTQLVPLIGPKYYAGVEARTVLQEIEIGGAPRRWQGHEMRPDVGVVEPFGSVFEPTLAGAPAVAIVPAPVKRFAPDADATKSRVVRIYETDTGELVTSIELLSPYNKRPREGLEQYRIKRANLLSAQVHLVEVDLLRGGTRPATEVNYPPLDADYILLVNRTGARRISEIWPVALNEPLPVIPVPLLEPDPDVPLDVNGAIHAVYRRARYDWRIRYDRPVPPPELRPAMVEWVKELLAAQIKTNA